MYAGAGLGEGAAYFKFNPDEAAKLVKGAGVLVIATATGGEEGSRRRGGSCRGEGRRG